MSEQGAGKAQETWTEDGSRFAVIDYDEQGNALVQRDALHDLLRRAGFRQEPLPPPIETGPLDGRAHLRRVAQIATPADPTPTETAAEVMGGRDE